MRELHRVHTGTLRRDLNERVNTGHTQAYITEIGRSRQRVTDRAGRVRVAPHRMLSRNPTLQQRAVRAHRHGHRRRIPRYLRTHASHERRTLQHLLNPSRERTQSRRVLRTDINVQARGGRNQIRGVPAVVDNRVNTIRTGNLLTQQTQALIRQIRRIQGVTTHKRVRGSMRAHARIGHAAFAATQPRLIRHIHKVGVHHNGGIHLLERTGTRHQLLTGIGFFGGRAVVEDPAAERLGSGSERIRQSKESAQTGYRNDVVAAAVTDARQRVVFGENRDGAVLGGVVVGAGELHLKGGIQPEGGVLDAKVRVGFADGINERAGSEILFVGSLGMRVNSLKNCGQRIRARGDGFGEIAANMCQSAVIIKAVPVTLSVLVVFPMTVALAAATFLLGLTVVSMFLLGMRVPALAAVLSGTLTPLGFEGKNLGVLATAHAISVGRGVVAGYCGGSVRCRSTGAVRSGLDVGGGALCVRVSHASTLPSALAGR